MLVHGENDNDVPIAESEQFYIALKDVGVPVVMVRYPREGHGLREPRHIVDLMDRSVKWYEKWFGTRGFGFGGDGGPATAAVLYAPSGVAVDFPAVDALIADQSNRRVRRVFLSTGLIGSVAGDGRGSLMVFVQRHAARRAARGGAYIKGLAVDGAEQI